MRVAVIVAAVCSAAARVRAQDTLLAPLREVRALIAAGKIEDAIQIAERYTHDHRDDARGFIALGDAWMKQMPAGRLAAARAYQEAERRAPGDPEPPFRFALVGLWLGGDDGEAMARHGLERVLELDPLYPDAWDDWLTLFRNTSSRRRMRERLAPARDNAVIEARIAQLSIEEERYREANTLLDAALGADSTNAAWLALRAQSAFEAGDTTGGWAFYRRALAHADQDSTDALWHQVVGIAWPWEIRAWGLARPEDRAAWIESFWARRNPNLFAGVNHRVGEHFARLRYARKHFPLLHPLISYHRSNIARAMNLEPSSGERQWNLRCEVYQTMPPVRLRCPPGWKCAGGRLMGPPGGALADQAALLRAIGIYDQGASSAQDRRRTNVSPWALVTDQELAAAPPAIQQMVPNAVRASMFAPLNLDLRSMDSVAARVGYNLATGLDDRGIVYLRLGRPDKSATGGLNMVDPQCASNEVERWQYAQYGEVRFARPNAFSHGERTVPDMVVRAMNERQFAGAEAGLSSDATSEPAPLAFGVWTSQLADLTDSTLTDLVVVTTRQTVAASLVGVGTVGAAVQDSSGVVTLRDAPGWRVLLAQVADSGTLGRQALQLRIRRFDRRPTVSGLLLGATWPDPTPDRAAMLSHVSRTLTFDAGTTVRSYAEVYGLAAEGGTVHYRVQYELLATDDPARDIQLEDWPHATRFEFRREPRVAGEGPVVETLDITPAQLPAGKYLLRVRVTDLVAGKDAGRGSISFAVR